MSVKYILGVKKMNLGKHKYVAPNWQINPRYQKTCHYIITMYSEMKKSTYLWQQQFHKNKIFDIIIQKPAIKAYTGG